MTNASTTQDKFILPVPPVGGLQVSQDRLDRMKLVRNHSKWKEYTVNLCCGNSTLTHGKSKADLAAESAFSLPLLPTWLGTQHKIMSLANVKKTHSRFTIPIKGCFSFICCKPWRHESESVKIMYLDEDTFLISSRFVAASFSSKY